MSVTLIVGLGNPGPEYVGTRHNLGFALVEALAAAEGLAWKREPQFDALLARWNVRPGVTRWLAKPQTYMNDSGSAVRRLVDFHKVPVASLVVAYDDLTIDLGRVKLTLTGSAGGHHGIASLLAQIGDGFIRYRMGLHAPRPAGMDLKDFVLGKFSPSEQLLIDQNQSLFLDGLRLLLDSGPAQAMNRLNRRDRHESEQA